LIIKLKTTYGANKESDKTRINDGFLYAFWGFNAPLDHFLRFLRSKELNELVVFCQGEKDKDDGIAPPLPPPGKKGTSKAPGTGVPAAKKAKKVIEKANLTQTVLHFEEEEEEAAAAEVGNAK
jgi:hypothetical protein